MHRNINKKKLIYKSNIGRSLVLSTMGTVLFAFNGCSKEANHFRAQDSRNRLHLDFQLSTHQPVADFSPFSLKEDAIHSFGALSCLKEYPKLGLIPIEGANRFGLTGSNKKGVLFYSPKNLINCSGICLSTQGITLSYLDGSIEPFIPFMEVDGPLLDLLSKDAQPLIDAHTHNPLHATCRTDFTFLTSLDCGIESFNDIEDVSTGNEMVLLKDSIDKTKFENIHHAGFLFSSSTSKLVEWVSTLLTDSMQSTEAGCSALLVGNKLQPVTDALSNATYFYIKNGNRYRLIPLNPGTASIKGYQYSGTIQQQIVDSSANKISQPVVAVTNGLKQDVQASSTAIQGDSLVKKADHEDKYEDLEWDDKDLNAYSFEDPNDQNFEWDDKDLNASFVGQKNNSENDTIDDALHKLSALLSEPVNDVANNQNEKNNSDLEIELSDDDHEHYIQKFKDADTRSGDYLIITYPDEDPSDT